MKLIIPLVLVSIIGLEAKPFGFGPDGLNWGGIGRRFLNGGEYGARRYGSGNSGFGNEGYEASGANGFHNNGGHNDRRLSVNEEDSSSFHDIGGNSAMNNGGFSGNEYNEYMDGESEFGRGFGAGSEMMMM